MSNDLAVRILTVQDMDRFVAFRHRMWPAYAAVGPWEVVRTKYLQHPQRDLCPGSGVYVCEAGGEIAGVMGAYPMPVTIDGQTHPGHMLVDWAVLPRFRDRPIILRLLDCLLKLPGRKFASYGSPESQVMLQRLGRRITAREGLTIVQPLRAAAIRVLHLASHAQPAPLSLEAMTTYHGVAPIPPDQIESLDPDPVAGMAYVSRDAAFWRTYGASRMQHGGVGLRIGSGADPTLAFARILQVGTIRFASLLGVRLDRATPQNAAAAGRTLRGWLRHHGIAALMSTLSDPVTEAFVRATGVMTRAGDAHWWSLRRPSDTFAPGDVRWNLGSTDRDSIWGVVEHSQVER